MLLNLNNNPLLSDIQKIAVGVSGGADSVALAHMLSQTAKELHVLSVDHGLRDVSRIECRKVGEIVSNWDNTHHHILVWEHDGVETGIQENARQARYELMTQKCQELGIEALCVAHHQDDQAETFLIRLSKGSGLDGLAGMAEQVEVNGVQIIRPLLNATHADLVKYCQKNNLDWIEDPSNENEEFERVRLRKARKILEEEGLSNKRLAKTAQRLRRGREALEYFADEKWQRWVDVTKDGILLNYSQWIELPEEIRLRLLLKCFETLTPERDYAPRMQKVEELCGRLVQDTEFSKATLGKLIFDLKNDKLRIYKEFQ